MSLSMDNFSSPSASGFQPIHTASTSDRDHILKAIKQESRTARLSASAQQKLMQKRIGKSEFSSMDTRELKRALRTLRERNGTRVFRAPPKRPAPPHAKIRALYWTLYYFGVVDSHNDWAMADYLKSNFQISDIREASPDAVQRICKSLMDKVAQCGVQWPQMADGREPGFGERRAVCLALWDKCVNAGYGPEPGEAAMIRKGRELELPQSAHQYSIGDWDKLLRYLGMKWRAHLDLQRMRD